MQENKYPLLRNDWQSVKVTLASDSKLKLSMIVRYDGYGNAIVRYEIDNAGRIMTYEKHDSAALVYQMELGKQAVQ